MATISYVQMDSPMIRLKDIPEFFKISMTTTKRTIAEIEEQIAHGRYKPQAIIRTGNIVLVNVGVFLHYLTYKYEIHSLNRNVKNNVPEFKAKEFLEYMGIGGKLCVSARE